MSEPEILRRCAVCGAASRPGAVFCPQCGHAAAATHAWPGAGAADRQDAQGGQELESRQTQKLDSADPTLQTRKLNSAAVKEHGRSESSGSGVLPPGSASSRKRHKKRLRSLKSALQATLAQKAALQQQGRDAEANQLDSQIEKQKQALEASAKSVRSPAARDSDVEASAGGDVESEAPNIDASVDVTVPEFERQPASQISAVGVTSVPPGPLEESTQSRVGKLRNASTVVFGEATYDAGVRFVLVAAVLFVLFLVILLLSKIIK